MSEHFLSLEEIGCGGSAGNIQGTSYIESPVNINGLLCGECHVGAFTYIQRNTEIAAAKIGRFCSIAADASIGPGEHPVDWLSSHPFVCDPSDVAACLGGRYPAYKSWIGSKPSRGLIPRPITVGNDVWIGLRSTVLRGVTIGDGAIVAAGAVVSRDVEPYSIVGGIPAKHIRYRFEESERERLLRLQWWNYDLRPLTPTIDYSNVPAAIDMIQEAIAAGSVKPLNVQLYEVSGHGAKLCG